MSTEFLTTTTEELAFVRFAGGSARAGLGSDFEFGTVTNWEFCRSAAEAGEGFFPECGSVCEDEDFGTPGWFDRLVVEGRAHFGRFPFTVELGSGCVERLTVER